MGKLEADTSPADVLRPKTSNIQDSQDSRLTESQRVRRLYLCVAASFMVMCILQVGLNIFLRWHGMGSAEVDKLKADINNLTSLNSAEIEHLKVELSNLTKVKSAEIEDLKAELNNLTAVKSAEIKDLKAELNNLTAVKSAEIAQLRADGSRCLNDRDQLQKEQLQMKTRLCQMEGTCEGWVAFKSKTYYVSTENKSWFESQQDCTDRGADLVIVNNREEQEFLHSLCETAWIGLSDQGAGSLFYWVDGTTAYFTAFWGVNEPSYSREKLCVIINRYYARENSWFGKPCEFAFHWICEKKGF